MLGTIMVVSALAVAPIQAQTAAPARTEMRPTDGVRHLGVSPAGNLWFMWNRGHLCVSHDGGSTWAEVAVPTNKGMFGIVGLGADVLDHVAFFDEKQGLIACSHPGDETRVFRTEDGGGQWTTVALPAYQDIEDVDVDAAGHAWLVGHRLFVSDDFGVTWRKVATPGDEVDRKLSVDFETPLSGAIASMDAEVFVTGDGGATWRTLPTLPTPTGQRSRAAASNVEEVLLLGRTLLVSETRREADGSTTTEWYATRLDAGGEPTWRPVRLGDRRVCELRSASPFRADGLIAVTEDRRIVLLSEGLEVLELLEGMLEDDPFDIAVGKERVTFLLDGDGRSAVLDERGITTSLMYSAGETLPPIDTFDRSDRGATWAASDHFLYASDDGGRHFAPVHELEGVKIVRADRDGEGGFLVMDEEPKFRRFERRDGAIHVDPAAGLDTCQLFLDLIRRDDLWLLGGTDCDDSEGVKFCLSGTDMVNVAAGFAALVFSSRDDGRTWSLVDRTPGAGLEAFSLGDDNVLTELLADGRVRRLPLRITKRDASAVVERTGAVVEILLPGEPPEIGGWIFFSSGATGRVGGSRYFKDPVAYVTSDGGATWSRDDRGGEPDIVSRLGGGRWVRTTYRWGEPIRTDLWNGNEFELAKAFPAETGVEDVHVDAAGRLVVRLGSGATWQLSADASTWMELGALPVIEH